MVGNSLSLWLSWAASNSLWLETQHCGLENPDCSHPWPFTCICFLLQVIHRYPVGLLETSVDCVVSPWGRRESNMTEQLPLQVFAETAVLTRVRCPRVQSGVSAAQSLGRIVSNLLCLVLLFAQFLSFFLFFFFFFLQHSDLRTLSRSLNVTQLSHSPHQVDGAGQKGS